MSKAQFKAWENLPANSQIALKDALEALSFNEQGLIPVIAQQYDSKTVLMMAWMNRDALNETLRTGRVCYYSRSRKTLWRKGESSGHQQKLKSLHFDCDGDCLLALVDQTGAACHTYRENCFFFTVNDQQVIIDNDPGQPPHHD